MLSAICLVEIRVTRLNGKFATLGHRVPRIERKIEQRQFHFRGVNLDFPKARPANGLELYVFAKRARQKIRDRNNELVDVEEP